ncbi:hypothetical protein BS47DRAFT_1391096 [Hydnum rufescens UP504]|uniref:Arrestin C-terminal-like domain-containing protein n=1 Tax=Hydnum rufescens UP504 TaxID=1448309 RepID=A0A9P6DW49_9AGAM|nr:hypothetical protein BS47DRAFT_1391096 [Hydnum rufescens UP504]
MSLPFVLLSPMSSWPCQDDRDLRDRNSELVPSALVRGLLVLNLTKRTKITAIEVSLEGHSVTLWPEGMDDSIVLLGNATDYGFGIGIGPRRMQLREELSILSIKTSLLDSSSVQRRAHSLGPGVSDERDGMYNVGICHASLGFPSNAPLASATFTSPHILDDEEVDNNDINLGHSQLFMPVRVSNPPPHTDPGASNISLGHSQPDSAAGSSPSVISSASSNAAKTSRRSARRVSFDSEDSYPVFVDHHDRPSASIPTIDDVYGASEGPSSPASNHHGIPSESPTAQTHLRSPLAPGHRVSPSLVRTRLSNAGERTYSLPPTVSRTTPPAPSMPGPQPRRNTRDTSDESSRERGRGHGRSSGFGWSVMSSLIREVSQDVVDAVDSVRRSSDRSASRGYPSTGRLGSLEPSSGHRREQSFGRGRAGSSSRDRSEGFRDRVAPDRNEARGRNPTIMPLGDLIPDQPPAPELPQADGWTEFSKGTYTYPISFMIPSDSPPSFICDFGQVSYRLQATVHRAGTFMPKLTASTPVTVVSCVGPDDDNELSNLLVERQWAERLQYVLNMEGAAIPIGGMIPLNLVLMPLDKISIHRITAHLEEKVHYYAHGRQVSRNEHPRQFELLVLSPPDKDKQPRLLPILSDLPMAAASSPLAKYARPESAGPFPRWHLLRHCCNLPRSALICLIPVDRIHFTNKLRGAPIVVVHHLRVGLQVSTGISEYDSNGKKSKMFDITVEMPVNILSCQCRTEVTHLPAYSATPGTEGSTASCSNSRHSNLRRPPDPSRTSTVASGSGTSHFIGDWTHHPTGPRRDAAAPEFPSLMMAHGPLFPTSAKEVFFTTTGCRCS